MPIFTFRLKIAAANDVIRQRGLVYKKGLRIRTHFCSKLSETNISRWQRKFQFFRRIRVLFLNIVVNTGRGSGVDGGVAVLGGTGGDDDIDGGKCVGCSAV